MNLKRSLDKNKHAFLSPSQYHWINYTPDKLIKVYKNNLAAEEGTKLHEFAAECILLKRKLYDYKDTLSIYVNDCIDDDMQPEELLWYSDNCFGTADAIKFQDNKLSIYDLKTGKSGNILQLYIYAAIFCLEYDYSPEDIDIELRLYINTKVQIKIPEPREIIDIMSTIIEFDSILNDVKYGGV